MKKILLLITAIMLNITLCFSQTSPYQIPFKWMFGKEAGLSFIGGALPTSPILSPPVYLAGNPNTNNQEGCTSVSDTTRNVVFYTPDGVNLYNSANALVANNLKGATSSTQNSVSFPDPASPTSQFYIVTANVDPTGGSVVGTSNGVNYVLYSNTGVLISSGNLVATGITGEFITISTDMNGGYWIISHAGGATHSTTYYTWHVTSSGIGATNTFSGSINGIGYQGSLKINNCQNKIGFVNFGSGVEIYNWNASTGTLGTLIYSNTVLTYGMLYGAEFSPDGTKFYYTSLINPGEGLYQIDMSSGNLVSTISTTSVNNIAEFGTMQLAADNKIYVINSSNFGNPAYIPTITSPNNSFLLGVNYNTTYFKYVPAPFYPNFYRGIANLGWTNPNNPIIKPVVTGTCNVYNFSYLFNTYFNMNINVVGNSETWDFGDGTGVQSGLGSTPSYIFPSSGTYIVTLKVTDITCNQIWTGTIPVTISCSLPVELINFTGVKFNDNVKLIWTTTSELNNNKFVIERSTDGVNFIGIGTVKGSGTTNTLKNWDFYDYYPQQGTDYYRLVQYDNNGKYTYSNIINVKYDSPSKIIVYPNPFNNDINIQILSDNNDVKIDIFDLLGRKIKEISSTTNKITLGADLSSGCYILGIYNGSEYYTIEIIKK